MIEVKIPQEITQYDAKIVGPFSARQAIFGGCAVGIGYLVYNQFHTMLSREQLVAIIFFVSVPFGLLGWARPYGMRFEKFFFGVLLHSMLHSSMRYFRSDDVTALILNQPSHAGQEAAHIPGRKKTGTQKQVKKANSNDCKKIRKKYRKQTFP